MLKKVNTATILVVLLSASLAIAQTKTAKQSSRGRVESGRDAKQIRLGVFPEISHFNHP